VPDLKIRLGVSLLVRALALVPMSLAIACSPRSLVAEAEAVQARTVPPAASTTALQKSGGRGESFRFTWTVQSDWSWEHYSE